MRRLVYLVMRLLILIGSYKVVSKLLTPYVKDGKLVPPEDLNGIQKFTILVVAGFLMLLALPILILRIVVCFIKLVLRTTRKAGSV